MKTISGRVSALTGYWYPSVTEILRITESPEKTAALRKWQHKMDSLKPGGAEIERAIAADRGTAVHAAIEKYLQTGTADETSETWQYLQKALLPLEVLKKKDLQQEVTLFNFQLKYCGRLDLLAHQDEQLTIIEFKTSKRPWLTEWTETAFTQAAAYSMCDFKYPITTLEVHVLSPNNHQYWKEKPEQWQNKWLERLRLFQEKIQTEKPPTLMDRKSTNQEKEKQVTIPLEKAYPGFYTKP